MASRGLPDTDVLVVAAGWLAGGGEMETLKNMLLAAKVLDNSGIASLGPFIESSLQGTPFSLHVALEKAIRRAAKVVEGCDRESNRWRVAESILKDAGLK